MRREQTIREALDHAVAVMAEGGVGALSVSETARRMGMRSPSLYKYFPSLHGLYDALFRLGAEGNAAAVTEATASSAPGVASIRTGVHATVRWCLENRALAQLLYWRAVPGFEPSPQAMAPGRRNMEVLRDHLTYAVRTGQLASDTAGDDEVRLLTILLSGVVSQQMANQPGAGYPDGLYARLTDDLLDMFIAHHQPAVPPQEEPDADPRP